MFKIIMWALTLALFFAGTLASPRALTLPMASQVWAQSSLQSVPVSTTTTIVFETVSVEDAKAQTPSTASAAPAATNSAQPYCECGYTYCASVLLGMSKPWARDQLADAYCNTPNSTCHDGVPETSVDQALYLCLCDTPEQALGDHLELLCGCETCLVVGPDFRGRCEAPCHARPCS